MIKYDPGNFGLMFIFGYKGSVFPKALVWAIPNAVLALLLHMYMRQDQVYGNPLSMTGVEKLWAGYSSVLGFLVVFRNNQAYTRFWEGATLINQVRGEWFNAVSTLFAFCNQTKEFQEKVETFQHTLVRLTSMLYCSALQQVCDLNDDTLEIIDNTGMDKESLQFMMDSTDRCEVLLQWIQRLIVDNEAAHTLKIAPPLLTRAFQELSRGIVNLNNARKIKDIPFPFPYAQMITVMLIVHWTVTPLWASQVIESRVAAVSVCFFVTFAFWCLIYIALEIDQPFGEDDNDLPLREMQREFNRSLLHLMHPLAQTPPVYLLSTANKSSDRLPSQQFETVSQRRASLAEEDNAEDLEVGNTYTLMRSPSGLQPEARKKGSSRRRTWFESLTVMKSSKQSQADLPTTLDNNGPQGTHRWGTSAGTLSFFPGGRCPDSDDEEAGVTPGRPERPEGNIIECGNVEAPEDDRPAALPPRFSRTPNRHSRRGSQDHIPSNQHSRREQEQAPGPRRGSQAGTQTQSSGDSQERMLSPNASPELAVPTEL
uniref:Bestrophin homolog n=1 Tax=Alexandrium monilatum TaxID=311494 RepID=A0A7S4UWY7_9DINO|mmetsp:Transcript_13861/g.41371  ORF Transcript_13861/g.41371 Transcript_13861/m.41371 type:complete len:540 (-) Transcript_13861:55-1674(-)